MILCTGLQWKSPRISFWIKTSLVSSTRLLLVGNRYACFLEKPVKRPGPRRCVDILMTVIGGCPHISLTFKLKEVKKTWILSVDDLVLRAIMFAAMWCWAVLYEAGSSNCLCPKVFLSNRRANEHGFCHIKKFTIQSFCSSVELWRVGCR